MDKKGKGDKKGKDKGKKSESSKDEKEKDEDKQGKGNGKANAKTTNHFPASCLVCRAWEHAKRCDDSAKSGKDATSQQRPITPAAKTTTGTPITGMPMQSDEGEVEPTNRAQWLYSVTKRGPCREEFLIESGAATSAC